MFDRIEAGTYLIAAALTEGNLQIKNVVPKIIKTEIDILKKVGAKIKVTPNKIKIIGNKKIKSLKIDPTTIGAITNGSVWTPLKNDFSGKELSNDRARIKPRLSSKNKVTTENFIERHIDAKKTSSKISLL
mgnify:CR=1 FL=1